MSKDTIYRQAAIETSLEFFVEFLGGAFYENSQKELIARFQRLPSAQPEVIRCKDCKWFRTEYGWNRIEFAVCGMSPTYHPIRREEDFCSKAERKEE